MKYLVDCARCLLPFYSWNPRLPKYVCMKCHAHPNEYYRRGVVLEIERFLQRQEDREKNQKRAEKQRLLTT